MSFATRQKGALRRSAVGRLNLWPRQKLGCGWQDLDVTEAAGSLAHEIGE